MNQAIAHSRALGACFLLVCGTALADETKPRLDPGAAPDVQDVIFFSKSRPVLMRLHVFKDGKPFAEAWDAYVQKLFKFVDRDGNGTLDAEECKKLIPPVQMQQLVAGNLYAFYNQGGAVTAEQVGQDAEGKVTLDAVKKYYSKQAQVAAMRIVPGYGNYTGVPGGNQLTTALMKQLGGKDGKLDLKKLANADDLVAKLDANDDETLDATELAVANVLGQPQFGRQPRMMIPGRPGQVGLNAGETSFVLVPKEAGSSRLTERLSLSKDIINRYDKDKSGKLTRDEIGLDADSFRALDRNGDGVLDSVELLRYFIVSPDIELTMKFGKRDSRAPMQLTRQRDSGLEKSLRRLDDNALMLALGTIQMELRAADSPVYNVQTKAQSKQYFDQIFGMVDQGKKGVVELQQIQKQANFQYMKGLFELADRDNDGKVTRQEFDDCLDMQAQAFGTTMTLTVSETSKGLFELVDTNRDGRLSVRELRAAAKSLAEYDINKDGILSEDEIPVQIQMALTPGTQPYYNVRNVYQPGMQPPRVSTAGPLWFRKMDRNGDGDVSKREFLGSPEDLKKLDLDGDGYISLEEAEKADALLRAKKNK